MEVAYQNDFKNKGHSCSTLVIRCMDFRFHEALEENIGKILEENACSFDSPGIGGGGSKSIIDEGSKAVLYGALNIAVEKHGVNRVVITDHIDCGAYGGSGKFESEIEEEKFHIDRLKEAKEIMAKEYPDLKIVLLYQDWNSIKTVE